jgi:hypothetical protein
MQTHWNPFWQLLHRDPFQDRWIFDCRCKRYHSNAINHHLDAFIYIIHNQYIRMFHILLPAP